MYRWVGLNWQSGMRNRHSAIRYKEGWSRHRGIHLLFFVVYLINWVLQRLFLFVFLWSVFGQKKWAVVRNFCPSCTFYIFGLYKSGQMVRKSGQMVSFWSVLKNPQTRMVEPFVRVFGQFPSFFFFLIW